MTFNVILAILSLTLARRKQGEERQLLRLLESNYTFEFGRESLSPKKWNGPGIPHWEVMEKLKQDTIKLALKALVVTNLKMI